MDVVPNLGKARETVVLYVTQVTADLKPDFAPLESSSKAPLWICSHKRRGHCFQATMRDFERTWPAMLRVHFLLVMTEA